MFFVKVGRVLCTELCKKTAKDFCTFSYRLQFGKSVFLTLKFLLVYRLKFLVNFKCSKLFY